MTEAQIDPDVVIRVRRSQKMLDVEARLGRPGEIKEIVKEAIQRHASFEDAAASLGTTRQTLWEWREKFKVGVKDQF